jgi:hypothetical protein
VAHEPWLWDSGLRSHSSMSLFPQAAMVAIHRSLNNSGWLLHSTRYAPLHVSAAEHATHPTASPGAAEEEEGSHGHSLRVASKREDETESVCRSAVPKLAHGLGHHR